MLNQKRVIIEHVYPQLDCGDHYIKRVTGEIVNIKADIIPDGHDVVQAAVLYKHEKDKEWSENRMQPTFNDEWKGSFKVKKQGFYLYKVQAWIDHPMSWQQGSIRKINDGQHIKSELLEGANYLNAIVKKATDSEKSLIAGYFEAVKEEATFHEAYAIIKSKELQDLLFKYPDKFLANTSKELRVYVDRLKARFSTWYEFFPRSASEHPGKHGTFKDCERLLPRVAQLGFDVLYFPPIHPIGEVNRKGRNNTEQASHDDVGSCWGIGSQYGGHKDIHSQLGSLTDFKNLIKKAKDYGIEIAMDYALQAAPDHPWVKDHPDWFKWRPDGTVQYAENPPKRYQDILPIFFESKDYQALWKECLDILFYWIHAGITIFRVDNPHTKPFYFWQWIIDEVKKKYPDVLFLAEAFTRPKVMQQLAKQGYTQSYTYFTWRNNKQELTEYMLELTQSEQREYMRPNFWPNTPDINPYDLQGANESKFIQRYLLAATLSSNTGIYGPVFEQMISEAIPGREEYLHSEKYELKHYNWSRENKLTTLISKINALRYQHKALQQTNNIHFCYVENSNLMAYYKWSDDRSSELLIIVSLDPYYAQQGVVQLPLKELGINAGHHLVVHDLITDSDYSWYNEWNFVELHPTLPFHLFEIKK